MATSLATFSQRVDQLKTTGYTVAATDSGTVINVKGTTTITLPAASGLVGLTVTVRNAGPNNGDAVVTVTPNAADGVSGNNFTAAVGKGPQNLTGNVGDEITLVCSGVTGAAGWYITNVNGTWTRLP
jgi:hypothetical protein